MTEHLNVVVVECSNNYQLRCCLNYELVRISCLSGSGCYFLPGVAAHIAQTPLPNGALSLSEGSSVRGLSYNRINDHLLQKGVSVLFIVIDVCRVVCCAIALLANSNFIWIYECDS